MASRTSPTPLWAGRTRGTRLSTLVAFPPPEPPREPFLQELGRRLFNVGGDSAAAVVGFVATMQVFVVPAAFAYAAAPSLAILALLPAIAWLVTAAFAGHLVHARRDAAPPWANSLVRMFTNVGRIVIAVAIVASILMLLYMLLAITVAANSGRR